MSRKEQQQLEVYAMAEPVNNDWTIRYRNGIYQLKGGGIVISAG